MPDPVFEEVCRAAADVLNLRPESLGADSAPATVEAWDSVAHVNLVLALEQAFSVQFDPDEIGAMTSIGAITRLVHSKREQPGKS